MNIAEMTFDEIQTRKAEIETRKAEMNAALETAEADALEAIEKEADELNEELRQLTERETAINEAAEARALEIAEVLENGTEKIELREENTMTNMEVRKSHEYAVAYAEYIKTGDDKECRALLTENVSGPVPVAEYAENAVRTAWTKDGITNLVRKTYLKGNLKIGFEISGSDAVVHTESTASVEEETLTLGVVELVPESIKKWINCPVAA